MILKKIGHWFELTKEIKTELSDILYDIATVSKDYQPEDNQMGTGIALGTATGNIGMGVALGSAMSEDEEYKIRLKGSKVTIDLDDRQIYEQFENGDQVRLAYRETQRVTSDYIPPNFERKQEIERVLSDPRFVSAEKLE